MSREGPCWLRPKGGILGFFEGLTTETVDVGAAGMGDEAYAEFRRAIHDPATVTAMLEEYRAGVGIDRAHEEADRAVGRRVTCPLLVLWSSRDDPEYLYGDPLSVWHPWSTDLRGGHSIDSGHHIAEEAPDELAAALIKFLRVR